MTEIKFIKSAYTLKDLPKDNLPQIVLCGRSNVGKSSFINTLFNKKGIAKTSSTPGKTRAFNYYLVNGNFYIVDLPGYGYAKVKKKEQEFWERMITEFLIKNTNIQLAFHFIDSRHNPSDLDCLLNDLIRHINVPYNVVLNKIDKLNQKELSASKKNILNFFPELIMGENLFLFSSHNGTGKKEIQKRINLLFSK